MPRGRSPPARTSPGCCSGRPTSNAPGPWGEGGEGAIEVRGPVAELAAWLLGRSKGRDLRTAEGKRPPKLPDWI